MFCEFCWLILCVKWFLFDVIEIGLFGKEWKYFLGFFLCWRVVELVIFLLFCCISFFSVWFLLLFVVILFMLFCEEYNMFKWFLLMLCCWWFFRKENFLWIVFFFRIFEVFFDLFFIFIWFFCLVYFLCVEVFLVLVKDVGEWEWSEWIVLIIDWRWLFLCG